MAKGLTNRQVGERLFISSKTVSVHVSNVLSKLGASGRAEAVSVAHRRGLLEVDPPDRPLGEAARPLIVLGGPGSWSRMKCGR